MTYDVEVWTGEGWATDTTISGRHGRRRALDRLHVLDEHYGQPARIIDRHGNRVRP